MHITFITKKKFSFSTFTFSALIISFLAFDIGLFASSSFYNLDFDGYSDLPSNENSENSNLVVIEFPPSLSIDTIIATEDCYQTGTATVDVSGGTLPYSYIWSNSGQTDQITNLSAGTYSVTVTDSLGLTTSSSVVVAASQSCSSLTCGNNYTKLNSYTTATNIQGALQYRFTFNPINSNAPKVVHLQAGNYIYFQNVLGLYYNTSYNWTVEVEYSPGVWGGLSAPNCTITFNEPESTLPCGNTYTKLNSYTTTTIAHGAVNYKFTFKDSNNIVPDVTHIQTGNYIYFQNVPNLFYNTTYNWTVEVEYEVYIDPTTTITAWGPPSDSTCTITFEEPESKLPCGNSYSKLNRYTTALFVTNAINYKFTFKDVNNLVPDVTHIQTGNYIYFQTVSNLFYNTTYNWTVEVEYEVYVDSTTTTTAWGPPSDSTCTITFEEPKSPPPCGNSYSKLNRYTTTPIVSEAINYKFTFKDINNLVPDVTHIQTGNYIYFQTIPNLYYNTTYNWTVEVEYEVYIDSVTTTTAWGPPSDSTCTITFEEPKSAPPCGNSYNDLFSYTTTPIIYNSTNYRFTFSETVDFLNPIQKIQQSNYIYFSTVTGLTNNTTYFWTVEVEYDVYVDSVTTTKAWGPPSDSTCTVAFNQEFFRKAFSDIETRSEKQDKIDMKVYPNPTSSADVTISVIGNEPSSLKVFSSNGQLHYEKTNIQKDTLVRIENLSPGTYFIRLQNNNQIINRKLIVI